jgi:hypothetical protein
LEGEPDRRGRLPIYQFKAGGKEVRHRLLLARPGFKPDEQSTLDHHFFSTYYLTIYVLLEISTVAVYD